MCIVRSRNSTYYTIGLYKNKDKKILYCISENIKWAKGHTTYWMRNYFFIYWGLYFCPAQKKKVLFLYNFHNSNDIWLILEHLKILNNKWTLTHSQLLTCNAEHLIIIYVPLKHAEQLLWDTLINSITCNCINIQFPLHEK